MLIVVNRVKNFCVKDFCVKSMSNKKFLLTFQITKCKIMENDYKFFLIMYDNILCSDGISIIDTKII